jgi:hypothetical protein
MHVAANKMPGDNIGGAGDSPAAASTSLRSLAPAQSVAADPTPDSQSADPIGSTTGLSSVVGSGGSKRGVVGGAGAGAAIDASAAAMTASTASKRGIDSGATASKRGVADVPFGGESSASKRNVAAGATLSASSRFASDAGAGSKATAEAAAAPAPAPAPAPVNERQGWLTVSAYDGKGWDSRFARLDAHSRLLLLFDKESMGAGTERAAIDLLSVNILEDAPPGAPSVAGVPTFWMALEDSGVFGPTKSGKPTPATAFQLKNDAEKAEWLKVLHSSSDRACATPTPRAPSHLFSNRPPLTFRREKTNRRLTCGGAPPPPPPAVRAGGGGGGVGAPPRPGPLFADAKGASLSTVLRLDADGVRIHFACDDAGTKTTDGWSNLRLEITAPGVGETALQTHIFRTRDYVDYCGWAAALAAL